MDNQGDGGHHDPTRASAPSQPASATNTNAQSMELDITEEDQVAQLLSGASTAALQTIIQREIRTTVQELQESVQSCMQDTVTAVKDTVGQALVGFRPSRDSSPDDADDKSDMSSGSPKRKKSKSVNNYHNVLRGYLASKGLWLAENDSTLVVPQLPPAQDLQAFVNGREGGPDVSQPRFDWTESFSHVWNDELLGLLTAEWIPLIEEQITRDELPEKFFNFASVKRILATKLRGVKTAFLRRYDYATGTLHESEEVKTLETKAKAKHQLKSRHASRAQGTYYRRCKIIEHQQRFGNNVDFWTAMDQLIQALSRKGMSSDESEAEAPTKVSPYSRARKVVRRVPLRWLRGEVAILWKYVEEHYDLLPPSHRRGNPPYDRIFEAEPLPPLNMAVAQHLFVVKNLPTNWYDPLYWSHLTAQGKRSVSRVAPRPLPTIPDVPMGN